MYDSTQLIIKLINLMFHLTKLKYIPLIMLIYLKSWGVIRLYFMFYCILIYEMVFILTKKIFIQNCLW